MGRVWDLRLPQARGRRSHVFMTNCNQRKPEANAQRAVNLTHHCRSKGISWKKSGFRQLRTVITFGSATWVSMRDPKIERTSHRRDRGRLRSLSSFPAPEVRIGRRSVFCRVLYGQHAERGCDSVPCPTCSEVVASYNAA